MVRLKASLVSSIHFFLNNFNSTMVRLKVLGGCKHPKLYLHFNSTMVRLKGKWLETNGKINGNFNSTMVRLKAVLNCELH